MKKITVSDYTLRKFAQDGKRDLLFREKTAIAACLERIGADRIELPPVTREKEDRIIYRTIAAKAECAVAIPAGYDEKSIDLAWECVREAKHPCLQIMLPVATAQMEYGFRAKENAMLENIKKLVAMAAAKGAEVEFAALDATRADKSFLCKACAAAQENGATLISLADDTGICLPEEMEELVKTVKAACASPLLISLADQIGLAPACALAAIKAGADGIKTALTGSQVLKTANFAATAAVKGESLGFTTGLKTTELQRDTADVLEGLMSTEGAAAAKEESAGEEIYLDAESTLTDVCEATAKMGYTLSDEDNGKVYKALMQMCQRKSSLGEKELEALIASYAMQAPSTYHLSAFSVNCTSVGASMAQVTMKRGAETICGVATGDGPVDAAFRAIEQSVGTHYELDDFEIQAVTEGKESLGATLVRLRNNGKLYAGNGLSTDIVGASIRAYINALNKIVYEEK